MLGVNRFVILKKSVMERKSEPSLKSLLYSVQTTVKKDIFLNWKERCPTTYVQRMNVILHLSVFEQMA